jgi:hypothetical protein
MALENSVNQVNPGSNYEDYGGETNFWSNAYSWEPKKQHQFVMNIQDIPAYLIKTSAKPTLSNGEITLDHMNVQRYVKGKSVWSTIGITLYDAIVPSAAQSVMEWVRQHHESATGRDGYSSIYKREIVLNQLSPLGEIIEEWRLKGAFITESNFGTLDWGSEEVVTIDLTLRFDWAFLSF